MASSSEGAFKWGAIKISIYIVGGLLGAFIKANRPATAERGEPDTLAMKADSPIMKCRDKSASNSLSYASVNSQVLLEYASRKSHSAATKAAECK